MCPHTTIPDIMERARELQESSTAALLLPIYCCLPTIPEIMELARELQELVLEHFPTIYVSPYYYLFTTATLLLPTTLPEIVELLQELQDLVLKHSTTIHVSALYYYTRVLILLYKCPLLLPLYHCHFTTVCLLYRRSWSWFVSFKSLPLLLHMCPYRSMWTHSRMRTLI